MNSILPVTLKHNFLYTIFGNFIYSICQWGLIVILAKYGSAGLLGKYSLGLAICAPIILFTNLQLRGVQSTDAISAYNFIDYFALRLFLTPIGLLLILVVIGIANYQNSTKLVIFMIGLSKCIESLSDVFYGLFQKHERMGRIAFSLVLRGVFSLSVFSLIFIITQDIVYGLAGLIFVWCIVLIFYDCQNGLNLILNVNYSRLNIVDNYHLFFPGFRTRYVKLLKLARLSFPLGIVTMLVSLNANIPKYFIERILGEGLLGVYSALAYMMVFGTMFVLPLGQSASPRLSKYYAEGDVNNFKNLLWKMSLFGISFGVTGLVLLIIFGKYILLLLYTQEYAVHVNILVLLMIGSTFSFIASLLWYGIVAARYFTVQVPLFLSVVIVNIVMCIIYVPYKGLYGAALALIMSGIVHLFGNVAIIFHAVKHIKTVNH